MSQALQPLRERSISVKQYRTRFLRLIALCYIFFPLLYLGLCTLLFDIPLPKLASLILSPIFYIISSVAVIAGFGIREMTQWGWYVYVCANILIGYETAVIAADYAQSENRLWVFLFGIFVMISVLFQVNSEMRVPYLLPKIRWWETDPSRFFAIPVQIIREESIELPLPPPPLSGQILDLSMGGCFIKFPQNVKQDEKIKLFFEYLGHQMEIEGKVVWRATSTVTHPKGVGVKFLPLLKTSKRKMRLILAGRNKSSKKILEELPKKLPSA